MLFRVRPVPAGVPVPTKEMRKMVEKSHTAASHEASWWPNLYEPLRAAGRRIADFFAPDADAAATKNAYEIAVELPGVPHENVDVSLHDGLLTVSGEKTEERSEEGKTYFFSERRYGKFQRSFRLPEDVEAGDITADFKDGVLVVRIPKRSPAAKKATKIEVRKS
jgi:HSP20 family protein